jgi:hypothetical protein
VGRPSRRKPERLYRPDDLLTRDGVGEVLEVKAGTMTKWLQRHPDFPAQIARGIWTRQDVVAWGRATGRLPRDPWAV